MGDVETRAGRRRKLVGPFWSRFIPNLPKLSNPLGTRVTGHAMLALKDRRHSIDAQTLQRLDIEIPRSLMELETSFCWAGLVILGSGEPRAKR